MKRGGLSSYKKVGMGHMQAVSSGRLLETGLLRKRVRRLLEKAVVVKINTQFCSWPREIKVSLERCG